MVLLPLTSQAGGDEGNRHRMNYSRLWVVFVAGAAALIWSVGVGAQSPPGTKTIVEADCTAAKLGSSIPVSAIGEPVGAVTLKEARWSAAGGRGPSNPISDRSAPDRTGHARPSSSRATARRRAGAAESGPPESAAAARKHGAWLGDVIYPGSPESGSRHLPGSGSRLASACRREANRSRPGWSASRRSCLVSSSIVCAPAAATCSSARGPR